MFYVFLMLVAALGVGVYLAFIFQNVPGVKEERLGRLEPLPADVNTWKDDVASEPARRAAAEGLKREVRLFYDEGRNRLFEQTRYRSLVNAEIVRVDADRPVKRRRTRK
jgi:hypothetical protein